MFTKKAILKKTIEVGGATLLSRLFGVIRELLMGRYLGANALSDSFLTAFKIPNSLRKIFAEGALSAAFIPTIVQAMRVEGIRAVNSLMTLGFLIFEGIVLLLCVIVIWKAEMVLWLIAPGFSSEQIHTAVPYLQIVMPFIFFLSSSALLAGALQAVGHFFVPALSPVLINSIFIAGLIVCLLFKLSVEYLCWFILLAGLAQLVVHVLTYIKLHFGFSRVISRDLARFGRVLIKFALCLPSVSMMEIVLFIDTSFASYLPAGSMTLIYYANRFMGIPYGIFPLAFSTVLLPHFARVSEYAPRRLSFYILETTKFVFWITVPVTLLMLFFSYNIFSTLFLSDKFTVMQAYEAASILSVFLVGLFFFSLNKILINMYYALHNTWIPAVVSGIAILVNIGLNFILIVPLQAVGLAIATVVSAMIQSILFFVILHKKFKFTMYVLPLLQSIYRCCIQLSVVSVLFLIAYASIRYALLLFPTYITHFLRDSFGFWLWVGPLSCLFLALLWFSRRQFGINLYFLDE